jgi:hypothetical protein
MQTRDDARGIDDLLNELRGSDPDPDPALLDRIRALGPAAVPSLIAYVTNPAEYDVNEELGNTGWGPYSAVELLGEMHPMEALHPLVSLLAWYDYDYLDRALPEALGRFGEAAIGPVATVLADAGQVVWTRVAATPGSGRNRIYESRIAG